MYNDFLQFLKNTNQEIFIDAEARRDKMEIFVDKYNRDYSESVDIGDEGICLLGNVDKWGVELRIYFNDITNIPSYWNTRKYKNNNYRSNEFDYRLDDNKLVRFLFDNGYRIGYN
jgi:hypothetical protein